MDTPKGPGVTLLRHDLADSLFLRVALSLHEKKTRESIWSNKLKDQIFCQKSSLTFGHKLASVCENNIFLRNHIS